MQQFLLYIYRRTWLVLLIAALTYYLFLWLGNPAYTNWFTIKGVPYSDAARWYEMAKNIADGQAIVGGWSAQRPFYSFTIASFFTWIGASLWLPILFNVICAALCVSLVFIIGERIFNMLTGWIAAIFFLLNPVVHDILFTITTEIYGIMLLLAGVLLLLLALEKKQWKWWALSGGVFALSELTRPLAMGLMPAIFLVAATMKGNWKQSLRLLTIFYTAFLLTIAPWLIRQKKVHGFYGVTDDTYESLYATSSPKFGSWDEWIKEEPANLGLTTTADNINYFKKAFFENLRTQPEVYIKNVQNAFYDFLTLPLDSFFATSRQVGLATGIMILFLLILYFTSYMIPGSEERDLVRTIGQTVLVLGTMAAVSTACFFLIYQRSLLTLLVSLGIILVLSFKDEHKRAFFFIFLFSGISLSLVAETNDYRFLTMVYWEQEMIYAFFTAFCLNGTAGLLQLQKERLKDWNQVYPRSKNILIMSTSIFAFLAISLFSMQVFPSKDKVYQYSDFYDEFRPQMDDILLWLEKQNPELLEGIEIDSALYQDHSITMEKDSLAAGRLWFGIGKIGDKQYKMLKNEAVNHTARLFDARSYDHVVVLEDYFATVFDRKDLSPWDGEIVLLVNRVNIDTDYIQYEERKLNENLAIIPITADFKPDYEKAYVAKIPEHQQILDSLGQISIGRLDNGMSSDQVNYNFFNLILH